MNIAEIETRLADLVKQPFEGSEFAFKFLEIYNAPKATLTKLRSYALTKPREHAERRCRPLEDRPYEARATANSPSLQSQNQCARRAGSLAKQCRERPGVGLGLSLEQDVTYFVDHTY